MPAVATYTPSSDPYINGVLGDVKWASAFLTYSYPTSATDYGGSYGSGETTSGFETLNAMQRTMTRSALSMYASVANLTFVEIGETATQHADLRFAMSDKPKTAWAYFPSAHPTGGDAWFNNLSGYYDAPRKGNYASLTFVHEIGHALGLEHAHEHFVMPAHRDSMEYTVMSYRSYVGASTTMGYTNETWGYAQSLMMYDIAAIQHIYGANYATNGGNTTYSWSPITGEMFVNGVGQGAAGGNRIFQTVWDGGGADTYDFSQYATALTVDLRPGEWTTTSATQLAQLHYNGSKTAVGNIANALLYNGQTQSLIENAIGGSGNDVLIGNQAANTLMGGAGADRLSGGVGNDRIDGGTGSDTAVFDGQRSQYSVTQLTNGSIQVVDLRPDAPNGTDIAWDIEWFEFVDQLLPSDSIVPAAPLPSSLTLTSTVSDAKPSSVNLIGTARSDVLRGETGNDSLQGRSGNDTLAGGLGNDKLYGQSGRDILTGGNGRDTFVYKGIAESRGSLRDTIKDFTKGTDRIDLRGIDANTNLAGNQAFTFIGKAAFSGRAGELKFSSGLLSGDVNGDGIVDFQIAVSRLKALSKGDFYL